ncbi:MAG: nitrilase-related carbon-nitrogen hydrolase [Chloroherpetonaceae bacterium]
MKAKVRVAQTSGVLANFDENLQQHLSQVEAAIHDGIEFIVFPELSLSGYNVQDAAQDIALPITDKRFEPLRALSKHISILCGGIELSDDFGVYNAAFFFEDGQAHVVHRKVFLPTYGMFEELRYFSAGQRIAPFHSRRLGTLGVAICEDNWHVTLPYLLAMQGTKVLFSLIASPLRIDIETGELSIAKTWEMMMRTYANLFSIYVVMANRVGNEDGLSYWGGSEIVSPSGHLIAKAKTFEPDSIDATIDLQEVKRARLRSSHFLDEDLRLFASELTRILNAQHK